jgi:hypothetical protein
MLIDLFISIMLFGIINLVQLSSLLLTSFVYNNIVGLVTKGIMDVNVVDLL